MARETKSSYRMLTKFSKIIDYLLTDYYQI